MCFHPVQPEEMTRLRSLNRKLQIDIDCTLKETDLLQSRGTCAQQTHTLVHIATHKPLKCDSHLKALILIEPSIDANRVESKVMDKA